MIILSDFLLLIAIASICRHAYHRRSWWFVLST